MWVSMLIFATVTLTWLRSKGYFPEVNESHMHDMAKWVFAISMLWSYLWFSQFMLIWYSNIPEEVTYYIARMFTHYKVPFIGHVLCEFCDSRSTSWWRGMPSATRNSSFQSRF